MGSNTIIDRADPKYEETVLSTGVNQPDLATMDQKKKKEAIEGDLVVCEQLVGAWSDCADVTKDCRELLDAAHKEAANPNGDLNKVHVQLTGVRQRLVQASRSRRSKWCVLRLALWEVVVFGGCVFPIWRWHLLPGLEPKLGSIDPNVVLLLSSFLIGAIGGIFDAAWSLSKNYAEAKFDSDHWLWHMISPFLGGILGLVVFVAFLASLITMTGSGIATENVTGNATAVISSASGGVIEFSVKNAFVLFIAFLAGFKQITVVDWIDGIASAVFKREKSENKS